MFDTRDSLSEFQSAKSCPELKIIRQQILKRVFILILCVFLSLCGWWRFQSYEVPSIKPQTIVVKPGDSLWLIALRIDPNQDPAAVVGCLERSLHADQLYPGEIIKISSRSKICIN